jgi:hypothetical protein
MMANFDFGGRPMKQRTLTNIFCIVSFFVPLLAGCTPTPAPPAQSSWAEQFAAAQGILKDAGGDFILIGCAALPVRDKPGMPGEPIELTVTLHFVSQTSARANDTGVPLYASRMVHYNDRRLAATLHVDEDFNSDREQPPDPASVEQSRLLKIGPQEVLQLTIKEGEAYMGKPVDSGNIAIGLMHASEKNPGLKNVPAAWNITFYRQGGGYLSIWVDAQTGEILLRFEQ